MKQQVTITGENLNVVVNEVKQECAARKLTKAEMRIEALKAKGVDTTGYFTLGDEQVVRIVNGKAESVDMIDEVVKKMVKGGYINHYKLFRRFTLAQMFHILREMENTGKNFTAILQEKGYEYSWRMLEHELYAQSKMEQHGDMENFYARNRWFNSSVVAEMMFHYIDLLRKNLDDAAYKYRWGDRKPRHTCHGMAYVKYQGKNIFVSDLDKKVFKPLVDLQECALECVKPEHIHRLLWSVKRFNSIRKKLSYETKQCQVFINAYKGSGSYFSMRNLIMFHDAGFKKQDGALLKSDQALELLEGYSKIYASNGWRMLGLLKDLIDNSNISIIGKLNEWAKD